MANILYCSDPCIIWHPHAFALASKYRTYQTPSGRIWHSPTLHINKNHVTSANIDKYNIINPDTGELYPIFLQVPCGRCPLCLEKKAQQWCFRALAETSCSDSPAYFVTLTYSDEYLPKDGVTPVHVQLFMKRLRIHLDRKGIKHNLRYIAVSEYGSSSGRAHYHLLLWNFPTCFGTAYSRLKEIESAWRMPTGEYNPDGSPVTKQIGWCYCVPVIQGGVNYVMKYMSKKFDVPEGQNPTFLLSSRKDGGIGSQFGKNLKHFYIDNPDTCDISLINHYTMQPLTVTLPAYYRSMFHPSDSRCLSREFVDNFKHCLRFINYAQYFHKREKLPFKFTYCKEFLNIVRMLKGTSLFSRNCVGFDSYFDKYYSTQFLSPAVKTDIYNKLIHLHLQYLHACYIYLDSNNFEALSTSHKTTPFYQSAINARMSERPPLNIKKALYDVTQKKYKHKRKEKI